LDISTAESVEYNGSQISLFALTRRWVYTPEPKIVVKRLTLYKQVQEAWNYRILDRNMRLYTYSIAGQGSTN